jgi:O-antigen/teichoic acid export membrane protein
MQQPADDSLRRIAQSTGVAVVGMALGVVFSFLTRLIIARYGMQTSYGTFSLALVVLQFGSIISSLGLSRGAIRYIAHFGSGGDQARVRMTMSAALRFSLLASIIVGLAVFLAADAIARNIFHAPDLTPALEIFAIGIPFATLTGTLVAFFRGFGRIVPWVLFQNIILNAIAFTILIIILAAGLPFITVFYAYLAAIILTSIILVVYTVKKLPQRFTLTGREGPPITRELLLFSLPLLGSSLIGILMMHIDTLMLGYFKTVDIVGLYNAAYPMASFISIPLIALNLMYTPVATGLFSQNKLPELRRNYVVLTKWLVSLTLPVFLVMALFPEASIHLLFGQEYVAAAEPLRILAIGFIINNLLGPNGETLLALGRPNFILWSTVAAAVLNVILNILLIPSMGMVGAAIASLVALAAANLLRLPIIYSLVKAQPFSKNLFKPMVISIALAALVQIIASHFFAVTFWMVPVIVLLFYGIYMLAMIFTRSLDKEDIALLLAIERRSGINTAPVKKLLRKLMRL